MNATTIALDLSAVQCAKDLAILLLKPQVAESVIARMEADALTAVMRRKEGYGDDLDPQSTVPWAGCTCGRNAFDHMLKAFNADGTPRPETVRTAEEKQAMIVITGLCLGLGTMAEQEDLTNMPYLIRKALEGAGLEVPRIYQSAQPSQSFDFASAIRAAMSQMSDGEAGFMSFTIGPNGLERIG